MIVEKRAPCLRGRFRLANHVFGHRRVRYLDAELEKLTMDPRCSPQGIGQAHLPNQLANFLAHPGPAESTAPTFPGPIETESLVVPGDYRFGLHDEQRRAPLRPEAREPNPEQSVRRVQTKPAPLRPPEDSYLMTESQDLNLQRGASAEPGAETNDRGKESSQHGGTLAQP